MEGTQNHISLNLRRGKRIQKHLKVFFSHICKSHTKKKKRKANDWCGELNGKGHQPVFLGGAHAEIYKIIHMKFI